MNMPANIVWPIFYVLIVTNMATVQNFDVLSDIFNMWKIWSSGNYTQKGLLSCTSIGLYVVLTSLTV
jgi:hypothetical protein